MNNLDDNSPKICQPQDINIELMEHQKTAVHAMLQLEKTGIVKAPNITHYGDNKSFNINTNLGILADKVGAGKSLDIITLINSKKTLTNNDNNHWFGSRYLSVTEDLTDVIILPTNILIVPHKLLPQWIKFFGHAPNLRLATFDTQKTTDDLADIDVLIIPCTKTGDFINNFNIPTTRWSRTIIDEADSIKLPKNFEFNSLFIWLITATPKKLRYNNRPYLANTFKDILPWSFDYLLIRNNNEFVEKSIILPPPKRITIECLTPKEIKIIQHVIPKNVISMINAGNTEDAIKQLNCNVDTKDNIIKVITINIKEVLDNKKLELAHEKTIKTKPNTRAHTNQEQKIKILDKCIARLQERYDSIIDKLHKDQYCSICMDSLTKPTLLNCCQSMYCFECITLSLNSTNNQCPFCRKTIYKKHIHIIDEKDKAQQLHSKREKLEVLLELVNNNEGRFMIFANYPQTFEKIKHALEENKITHNILKGSASDIGSTIDNFTNNKIKVLMLNTKHFGAGMNLQMATHIIFYHRFESREIEEQAIGRAQRLGRTGQLSVFYLLHDNELNNFDNTDNFEDITYQDWLTCSA
jgi:SNF2 family DNA or RNA helicase